MIPKEKLLSERLTLAKNVSSTFVGEMCVCVSRPMKLVTFHRKTVTSTNWLLIFFWKETHSENIPWKSSGFRRKKLQQQQQRQTLEIFKDFASEAKFLQFSLFFPFFFIFLHFSFSLFL